MGRKRATPETAVKPGLYVGTSGWSYGGWDRLFYPDGVKTTEARLAFYARHFDTVEINYTFYHLPKPQTYEKWKAAAPTGFLFAVKASRYITHILRLQRSAEAWARFLSGARTLGRRLGPILFQLPPSFRADHARLSRFLEVIRRGPGSSVQPVFEFRHSTWFTEATYELLRGAGAALCIAHSSRYPCVEEPPTAEAALFVYYRFHGPGELFASRYSDRELRVWARRIRFHQARGAAVYVYFNNDVNGYAVDNARMLRRLIETE
ncbi:MAG TPA: DUF72 domain-containing protein [Nitrospiria bacterium]|nr:DUF72 domain-containing protein [Nitrospiria bacterium]